MSRPSAPRYDLFISYADADRAWVEGYLFDALDQAGVVYHSEAAFALGVPRLVEFERAILESRRTLLVLSPAYLADGFTGFTDLLAQSYGVESGTWPVVPLLLRPVQLPPRIAMLKGLEATEADLWPAAVQRLCAELHRPLPAAANQPPCPYPGMVPFRAEDARFFHGREEQVFEMVQHLRTQRLLFVIGPSGSGKSSLVRAGLLPELARSKYFAAGFWRVREMRPGGRPLEALAEAFGADPARLEAVLEVILAADPPAQRLLLVVDQFEECFAQADRAEQGRFIAALKGLWALKSCAVLVAMRADFYPELMQSDFWPIDPGQRIEVAPLRGEALRRAIERPAAALGVHLEAGLVERLLADAADEPGVLPLIQETMVLLWGQMRRRLLPLAAYEQLGKAGRSGLAVALATRADACLAELPAAEQGIARRIFLRLVQFGEGRSDTRRQQRVADLRSPADQPGLFDRTLQHLAEHRLLTLGGEEGEPNKRVDIAHEMLIVGWPRSQEWVQSRREAELARRRLEAKADEWVRLGRSGAGLLDPVELAETERWLAGPDAVDLGSSADLQLLVRASREAIQREKEKNETYRRRRRRTRLLVAGTFVSLIVLGLSGLLFQEQRRASEARQRASEANRMLARMAWDRAVAAGQQGTPARALLWLARGLRHAVAAGDAPLEDALRTELAGWRPAVRGLRGLAEYPGDPNVLAVSPDGRTVLVGDRDGTARLWDLTEGRQVGQDMRHPEAVRYAAISPDGKTALTRTTGDHTGLLWAAKNDTAFLWDAVTGRPIKELRHLGPIRRCTYHPKGQVIATAGDDRAVRFWSTVTGEQIDELPPPQPVECLAFSPDGERLATGSTDGIRLWRTRDWSLAAGPVPPPGQEVVTTALDFSPDGKALVSAHRSSTAYLWDVTPETFRLRPRQKVPSSAALPPETQVIDVAFGPVGKTLLMHDGSQLHRRNVSPWAALDSIPPMLANRFLLSPDRRTLIADRRTPIEYASPSGATLWLWDVPGGRALGTLPLPAGDSPGAIAFAADGQTAVVAANHLLRVFEVRPPGEPVMRQLGGRLFPALPADLAANGRAALFSYSETGPSNERGEDAMRVWDLDRGVPLGPAVRLARSFGPVTQVPMDRIVEAQLRTDGAAMLARYVSQPMHRIWDLTTCRPLPGSLGEGPFQWAGFAPDGKTFLLVRGDERGSARLWSADGQPAGPPFQLGRNSGPLGVQFHPSGKAVLVATQQGPRCWDPQTGRPSTLGGPEGSPLARARGLYGARFSPDGTVIVTDSLSPARTRQVCFWSAQSGQPVGGSLSLAAGGLYAIHPAGKSVAALVGSPKRPALQLLRIEGAKLALVRELADAGLVEALAFDPRGRVLAAGVGDQVRFWDARSGEPREDWPALPAPGIIKALSFRADGAALAVGTSWGRIELWDMAQPGAPRRLGRPLELGAPLSPESVIQFSRDGKTVLTLPSRVWGSPQLWDARTGEAIGKRPQRLPSDTLAGNPDSRVLIASRDSYVVQAWDPKTGRTLTGPCPPSPTASARAFSPDGKRVLVWEANGTVRLYELAANRPTGKPLALPASTAGWVAGTFSPDGRRLVTSGTAERPQLWDTLTGERIGDLATTAADMSGTFSPDGEVVATIENSGECRLWSAATGAPLAQFPVPEPITSVHFAPGRTALLARGARQGWLIDLNTRRVIGEPLELAEKTPLGFDTLAFDSGGRWLLGEGREKGAQLWSVPTARPVGAPLALPGRLNSLAFGPDGKTAVIITSNGFLVHWKLPVPVKGDVGKIVQQVSVLTGEEIGDDDVIRPIPVDTWKQLREELAGRDFLSPP
jgi:WD40 repeat protein